MPDETPEQIAARAAAEDAAATGGFEDDEGTVPEPVLSIPPSGAESQEEEAEEAEEEVEVPEGARNPDAVKRAIEAERKAARAANARARELEAELNALKETPAAPAGEPDLTALRYGVALDLGLSRTLANRLQGSTEEELKADAEALLSEVGTGRAGMDGGFRTDPPTPADPMREHNQLIAAIARGRGRN